MTTLRGFERKLRWKDLYKEQELYKAALKVYTKALFRWQKALSTSLDGRTLYDFARHGLKNLGVIHRKLASERFHFEAGTARTYNFNGKRRTLYIYPWEEKIVDLLLYRLLNAGFHRVFSSSSYAYRHQSYGVDLCQTRIAALMAKLPKPLYVFKRDIANYFDSIDHDLLGRQLSIFIERNDYLCRLLGERIQFPYLSDGNVVHAGRGVPFGTPIACFFANLYLTELDHRMSQIDGLHYFRYADDLLGLAHDCETLVQAATLCDQQLSELNLASKPSHCFEAMVSQATVTNAPLPCVAKFRHLGLEFRASGCTGLSRDKARKLRNLFRYAFRRKASKFRRINSIEKRALAAVEIARETLLKNVRHVAIIDYYLKHVRDEAQLRLIDRWLAEEVLSITFQNGHKKGNFRRLSFNSLRAMGLPSLVHRARLIRHGQVPTSFFQWREYQRAKRTRGGWRQAHRAFSPGLEAVVNKSS